MRVHERQKILQKYTVMNPTDNLLTVKSDVSCTAPSYHESDDVVVDDDDE